MSFADRVLACLQTHDLRLVELEFRIRHRDGYIPKSAWARAKSLFRDGNDTGAVEMYARSQGDTSVRYNVTNAAWEYKKRLCDDVASAGDFSVKTAMAVETSRPGPPPGPSDAIVLQRSKKRTSFSEGPWRIDFTEVAEIPSRDKDREDAFEIEVELADRFYLFEKEMPLVLEEGMAICRRIMQTLL